MRILQVFFVSVIVMLFLIERPVYIGAQSIDPAKVRVTASASESERQPPQNAFDGNMSTRWSSPFSDPQWLKIDLGEVQEIGGIIIFWETAFGSMYDILISKDDKDWEKVYSTEKGDGNSDEIYFGKRSARYVKILGHKRATAWGFSIFELKVIDASLFPVILSTSNVVGTNNLLDGNQNTVWTAATKGHQLLTIDFVKTRKFGGFVIDLDRSVVTGKKVSISEDGKDFKDILSSKRKVSNRDYIYLDNPSGRYVKLEFFCEEGPLSIKEITVKGPEEKMTREKNFEIAASQSPKGSYPRWIYKEQEYWTAIGVADDIQESLISESGILEPWHYSFSLAPFLRVENRFVTGADVTLKQSLDEGCLPLPRVEWIGGNFDLVIDAFSGDASEKSSTYIKYTVRNKSQKDISGEFYLAVRPFQLNPPWMHGGLAEIKSIRYDGKRDGSMMQVNDRDFLFVPQKPDGYGTSHFERPDFYGDIVEDIASGTLSGGENEFIDKDGLGSSCLMYSFHLKPGESASHYFIVPLHNRQNEIDTSLDRNRISQYFEAKRIETKKFWSDKLGNIGIILPDREFVDTLKSNLAYILINDDKLRLQPGSRNYEMSWMRDGSLMASALLSMGFREEVKRYLDWISGFVKSDGWVPFMVNNKDEIVTHGWKEFDSQGQYIYAIFQYYLFTKDKDFLSDKKQKVMDDINYMKALRNQRMGDEFKKSDKEEFFGIFPESASHEGYIDPPRHSYWDDFWGLRGLRDAERLFRVLGDDEKSKWAHEERMDFGKDLYQSIRRVMKKKNIKYVPGCAELGDPDPTSTAIALWPCAELENLSRENVLATFDLYWSELRKRFNKDWKGGFTPYELRNANALLILGQRDKLYRMLAKFFEWKRPRAWNHWAEVVTSDDRMPQYLGDMPHTWIAAEYINAIRNLLIFEEEDVLYLGKGLPEEWLRTGKKIEITDMPTHFGKISYRVESNDKKIQIVVSGEIEGTKKIVFTVPPVSKKILSVKLNGIAYNKWKSGEIIMDKLPAEITIEK